MKRTQTLFLLLLVLFVLVSPNAPASGNAADACQVLRAACQDPVSFTCDSSKREAVCETFSPSQQFADACNQFGGYYDLSCPIIDLWPCIETCSGFTP
jgi:hypothetical protein